MITLIRWYLMKSKEVKMKLAFWSFMEQILNELTKNSEKIEKRLISEFAKLIHEDNKSKTNENE